MVLDDLLDLGLKLRVDVTLGNLGEEGLLSGSEVLTELSLPLGDLLNGDGVELGKTLATNKRHVKEKNLRDR